MFYKNIPTNTRKIKYKLIDLLSSENFDFDNDLLNSKIPQLRVNFKNSVPLTASYGEEKFNCFVNPDSEYCVYPSIGDLNNIINIKYFVNSKSSLNDEKKQMLVLTSDYKLHLAYLDDGSVEHFELTQLTNYCDFRFLEYGYGNENYVIISTKYLDSCVNYVYKGYGDIPLQFSKEIFIHDICVYNKVMYLVPNNKYRNQILFSEDINPINIANNISSMGCINIPSNKGEILKLLNYNDNLYVFCEYGILKINTNQNGQEIEEIYNGSSKIIENSIVLGLHQVIFTCENGIYEYKGNTVTKIKLNFESIFNTEKKNSSFACFNEGKYYLATKINYQDGIVDDYDQLKNNCLIVYDVNNGELELLCDISISQIITYQDGSSCRVAILSGSVGAQELRTLSEYSGVYDYNKISRKLYVTQNYNLSKNNNLNLIRFLYIKSDEDVNIIIHHDNKETKYAIRGNDDEQKICLNIRAYNFRVELISETRNPNIESIKLLVGVYE